MTPLMTFKGRHSLSVSQWNRFLDMTACWAGTLYFTCLGGALKKNNKERGSLFQSSHNDIPIKQSRSQLITGVACRGKQIPRHERGSVRQYPVLRKKHCSASVCFRPACSSYLPENVDGMKEQGRSTEMSSRRVQQLIYVISQHRCRKCVKGPVGVQVRVHKLLVCLV